MGGSSIGARVALRIGVTLAAVAGLLGSGLTASPANAVGRVDYVNLGDSYSAGSGVMTPRLSGTDPQCWQSTDNYAHVLARTNRYRLTDVSCGAAATDDFYTRQMPTLRPQLDALSAKTDLVTVMIGGNDGNVFGEALEGCATAGVASGFRGHPCQTKFGNTFAEKIRTGTYPAVKRALADVHRRAPNARVLVGTYPWLVPAKAQQCQALLLAPGDVRYTHDIQRLLNEVIVKAAHETGTEVVDFAAKSVGHDACQRPGVRWVAPIVQLHQVVPAHPNARGERQMARIVAQHLAQTRRN